MLSQIPNFLTLARIAACPALVLLLHEGHHQLALYLFVLAGVTDGLDGFIAKRFDWQSALGAVLDPVADKLLIASACVMLTLLGDLPFWLLVLILFRDLVIVAGYLILAAMGHDAPPAPTYSSKINTFLQIALVAAALVDKSGLLTLGMALDALMWGVAATTVLSGVQYVWQRGIKSGMEEDGG